MAQSDGQGSIWRRWDPHIHAPGTVLADRYAGESDPWETYFSLIEASDPPIQALGVTDYLGLDLYERVRAAKEAGRLSKVGLIFPNIELRFSIGTPKGNAINVHLLVSPDDPNHIAETKRFLLALEFRAHGTVYRCQREDLIRLGKRHDTSITDDQAALRIGTTQFKVGFDQLRSAFDGDQWARENILVAVAGGSNDGTSGLQDSAFNTLRREIEGFASIIFSSQPKQRDFWLGRGAATIEDLKAGWGGMRACLHGSDAHDFETVGNPHLDRFCWLKGDLRFESLRQACIEPEGRTHIGKRPPGGALPSQAIREVAVVGAAWLRDGSVPLNPGLVAIIGARGSGKTALADLIAAGANAHPQSDKRSFLIRAKPLLKGERVTLKWSDGRQTTNLLVEDLFDILDPLAVPEVRYLSQQFVDRLCSAEGVSDDLLAEIKRVIFLAHGREARLGATDFAELMDMRAGRARANRAREQEAFAESSDALEAARIRKSSLPGLQKQRQDKVDAIAGDKRDRVALMGKTSGASGARLDAITRALDAARARLDAASRRVQAIGRLKDEVSNLRTNLAPARLRTLQANHNEAGLTPTQWNAFGLVFAGDVDTILATANAQASDHVAAIYGPAVAKVAPEALATSQPFFANDVDLATINVNRLDAEASRLQGLAGIDAENSRKLTKLAEKITQSELELAKIDADIALAQQADARITELVTLRGQIYERVFAAVIEEQEQLASLYSPLEARLSGQAGSLGQLSFSVRRTVDLARWAKDGEALLDLRKNGPFRGQGSLYATAKTGLAPAWESGSAAEVAAAMREFRRANEAGLVQHVPEEVRDMEQRRAWGKKVAEWLYDTTHVTVAYGIRYGGAEIEQLSPGTRGIVLLLLYLAIDQDDDRPLIIDQPEENLDPKSIFEELVDRFREAKTRRQIIVVTHNANLVVNTDADQVIVATCGPHLPGRLPEISYRGGGLEDPETRAAVCDILEGGEEAFMERARRLRVSI